MIESHNKPLRVLHVIGALNRGGIETWIMDIVRNTRRDEFAVDVCVTNRVVNAYEDEFESLGGKIWHCPLDKRKPWNFCRRFSQVLRAAHYDIVHSHMYYFSGLVLMLAARAGVPKRISHIHPVEDLKVARPLRRFYVWWMKRWIRHYGTSFVGPTQASLAAFFGPAWR